MTSLVISLLLVLFHQSALCLGSHALEGPPLAHFGYNFLGGEESTEPVNVSTQSHHSLSRAYFLGLGQPFPPGALS